jgi:FtsH-binding integral membrane protein
MGSMRRPLMGAPGGTAFGWPRPGLRNPAAVASVVLGLAGLLVGCVPERLAAAYVLHVLAGLVVSLTATALGWAGLRRARTLGGARHRVAVAGTALGVVGVVLLLFQLPGLVLAIAAGV